MASNPIRQDAITADKYNNPLLGAAQDHFADAVTAHSAATTDELDALGTKLNQVIAVLESHGLMKDA